MVQEKFARHNGANCACTYRCPRVAWTNGPRHESPHSPGQERGSHDVTTENPSCKQRESPEFTKTRCQKWKSCQQDRRTRPFHCAHVYTRVATEQIRKTVHCQIYRHRVRIFRELSAPYDPMAQEYATCRFNLKIMECRAGIFCTREGLASCPGERDTAALCTCSQRSK